MKYRRAKQADRRTEHTDQSMQPSTSYEEGSSSLKKGRREMEEQKRLEQDRIARGEPTRKESVESLRRQLDAMQIGGQARGSEGPTEFGPTEAYGPTEYGPRRESFITDFNKDGFSGDKKARVEQYKKMHSSLCERFKEMPRITQEEQELYNKNKELFKTAVDQTKNKDFLGISRTRFGEEDRDQGETRVQQCINELETLIHTKGTQATYEDTILFW